MITEWQPVMPDDQLKLKSRTIYEFLRTDKTTFLEVGRGDDQPLTGEQLITSEKVVGYREFDCRPYPLNCEPPKVQGKKP